MPAVVIAAGIVAYLGSFHGVFLFDDLHRIVGNANIRGWASVWHSLPRDERPVVSLSLALNYAVSGEGVWSYHLFNLTVHLLAALTLFGVVTGTLRTRRFRGTASRPAREFGFVVALLWALHPLQTESVTYVIQRAESMMGLFYLLTFYCVIRGAQANRPWPWYLAAVIACALGMGSKAVMITAPVLLLLYDRVFLGRSMAEVLRRRWALHVGLFGTLAIFGAIAAASGFLVGTPREDVSVGLSYQGSTPLEYALTQPGVILHYLRLSLWPHPLCLDYEWPLAKTAGAIVIPLLPVTALLAGTIASFRRWPPLGFAGAWFFLVLAPSSSFFPIADPAFEHRMYLPLAAVIVVVAVGFQRLLSRAGGIWRLSHGVLRTVLVASVVLTAGACAAVTARRQQDYQSATAMWASVVKARPTNPRAHRNLGLALAAQGKLDEAIVEYREAIRLDAKDSGAHDNLGRALAAQGKLEEAIAHYRESIRLNDRSTPRINLGAALEAQGKLEEALVQYREAVRLNANSSLAQNNLGATLVNLGRIEEAVPHYREAIRLDAGNSLAHENLGVALAAQGKFEEAISQFRDAIRMNANYVDAYTNLGALLAHMGRREEAIPYLRRALELDPNNANARRILNATLEGPPGSTR